MRVLARPPQAVHRVAMSCLYFKLLVDLDVKVVEALIAGSVAEVKRRYPSTGDA